MSKKEELIVGLDIGTTKVCAVVGEVRDGGVDVVGFGISPSKGLRKGVVINIESTVNSIKKAIEDAELMAGCEINNVYAGISGGHIKGFNTTGVVAVKDREVKQSDIRRVLDTARAQAIPPDREVIHLVPQEFIIDGQDGIKDPLGMSGIRLEARAHIVTANVTCATNIVKCANRAGLNVSDIFLEQFASSESVLTDDEKELGVALVDIGGGTTDLAVFYRGSVVYTNVLPRGGSMVTSDIACLLKTPMAEAEKLKQRYGCAYSQSVPKDEVVNVPSIGAGREPQVYSRTFLCEIIEDRIREIYNWIADDLRRNQLDDKLAGGLVITGGASLMSGMIELAEECLSMQTRLGVPMGIGGMEDVVSSPIYSTGVGLLLYGVRNRDARFFKIRDENIFSRILSRMRSWYASSVV